MNITAAGVGLLRLSIAAAATAAAGEMLSGQLVLSIAAAAE